MRSEIPGRLLRRFAARLFSAPTMDRLIDPILADQQKEFVEALSEGRLWRARVAVVAGYWGLGKALLVHGANRALKAGDGQGSDARRVIIWSSLLVFVTTSVLAMIPLLWSLRRAPIPSKVVFILLLLPQALPVAIPVGLALGVGAAV